MSTHPDLLGKYACAHCRHDQYEHNLIVGCPYCRCMATPGEAGRHMTHAQMDAPILPPDQMLPGYDPAEVPQPRTNGPVGHGLLYDEAVAAMADPERYETLRRLTFDERHPCPVKDCRLSAEEHHRLAFGMIAENRGLKRRVADLERALAEAGVMAP